MREFFRGAGTHGGAQGFTGNWTEKFHSSIPFQLLLVFSADMYHSPVYCYRDWETSKGVGTTSEGAGTVTMVFFFPKIHFGKKMVIMIYEAKLTHLL